MENWVWETFNTTPIMSSYIVAMIVCDFDYNEAPPDSFGDTVVRVQKKKVKL